MWLSWLVTVPWSTWLLVWILVRPCAWLVVSVPGWGALERQPVDVSLSLSTPLSKSKLLKISEQGPWISPLPLEPKLPIQCPKQKSASHKCMLNEGLKGSASLFRYRCSAPWKGNIVSINLRWQWISAGDTFFTLNKWIQKLSASGSHVSRKCYF